MGKKVAIYHFTNKSESRPIVYKKEIEKLERFVEEKGWSLEKEYIDFSINKSEHEQFELFMKEHDRYDILLTKDFYHLTKNTRAWFELMKTLRDDGLMLWSLENGVFIMEETPFDAPLRVVTYNSRFIEESRQKPLEVQNEIFRCFVNSKTNWTIVDQYYDESRYKLDGEQINLQELIENKDKYDLLLVKNMNDIHWRTAKFCKIREKLGIDIYSLQDGFIKYRKESELYGKKENSSRNN